MLFKKIDIKNDFAVLNKLVYGFPKVGKTTFASCLAVGGKPPLFVFTEDGNGVLDVYGTRIYDWATFKKMVAYIETNKEKIQEEHSCIIVDLLSDLDQWCTNYILDQQSITSLADLGFGKGFTLKKAEFTFMINRLFSVMPITFITHSREKEINWNGEKIQVQAPTLDNSSLDYVNGKVDCTMWLSPPMGKDKKQRLILESSNTCIAGSRFPQVVGTYDVDPTDMSKTVKEIQSQFVTTKGKTNGNTK